MYTRNILMIEIKKVNKKIWTRKRSLLTTKKKKKKKKKKKRKKKHKKCIMIFIYF